jgi:hypothetical protein
MSRYRDLAFDMIERSNPYGVSPILLAPEEFCFTSARKHVLEAILSDDQSSKNSLPPIPDKTLQECEPWITEYEFHVFGVKRECTSSTCSVCNVFLPVMCSRALVSFCGSVASVGWTA